MSTIPAWPVSTKQRSYIEALLAERDTAGTRYAGWQPDWSQATGPAASKVITFLQTLPKLDKPTPASGLAAGIYQEPTGALVRVYLGQKSGALLAKQVVLAEGGVQYAYLGAAARVLTAGAKRLSLAEVGALGREWDHCLSCGRRLDDPESVDRGIGPVCAKKY